MESIGGYFSLELPYYEEYHKDAIKLNTGRNCLEYILRIRKYRKIYIPYYTCEVVLEPFHKLDIQYEFYHIDFNFEIVDEITLEEEEALLYTNYYGLKQEYTKTLAKKYGTLLIVDNTQAFFAERINGIDTFYTCRKFFGVPDGAYLYTDVQADFEIEQDVSYERMNFLLKRIDLGAEAGFVDFQTHDENLAGQPIKRMSSLTERLMKSINYEEVKQKRRANYKQMHNHLRKSNLLQLSLGADAVPMIYPYYTKKVGVRQLLIQNKIFIAKYWPNVIKWCTLLDKEYLLTENIMCLPIDQRYESTELDRIVKLLKS